MGWSRLLLNEKVNESDLEANAALINVLNGHTSSAISLQTMTSLKTKSEFSTLVVRRSPCLYLRATFVAQIKKLAVLMLWIGVTSCP